MLRRGPQAHKGAHQVCLAVRATVRRESVTELLSLLERMGGGEAGVPAIPFVKLRGVHFARLLVLEDSTDVDEQLVPASLLWMSDVDAPLESHLDQLAALGGPGLDAAFGLCEGYPPDPTPEMRSAYLREHLVKTQANYVNTVGRTVAQIHGEAALREAIEGFLDRRQSEGRSGTPEEVRAEIQAFVRGEPALAWATRRAARPSLLWRCKELLHAVVAAAGLVIVAPVALVLLPVYAIVLRLHERSDPAPHLYPTPKHEQRLAAIEDHVTQNQFSAAGNIKPGRFRERTIRSVTWLIDYGARHIFNRASLAGIKTIHFAHWMILDDGRRGLFTSNYDGSHESYMDDFIDKIAFGVNLSFSSGVGFPKTRFLLFEGARREQEFKDFQRCMQIPTQVWYSAYPQLSTVNIENNALIRSGLFGTLTRPDTEAWLRRF